MVHHIHVLLPRLGSVFQGLNFMYSPNIDGGTFVTLHHIVFPSLESCIYTDQGQNFPLFVKVGQTLDWSPATTTSFSWYRVLCPNHLVYTGDKREAGD